MKNQQQGSAKWINTLSAIIRSAGDPLRVPEFQRLDDYCVRIAIVVRTRWIMLLAISLYTLFAALSYKLSTVGFRFSNHQTTFLVLTIVSVILYNTVLSSKKSILQSFSHLVHLQVVLDLFFVTVLIHFTGGVVSWFWPVYLLVTIESAFLLDDKRDVWLIGTLGATFYGSLLAVESVHLVPHVAMPFIDSSLHEVFLFQLLMWCWVAGMNATVAFVAAFMMDTIRSDNRRVKEGEEALLSFITSANDLIFSCDQAGRILYANQVFLDLLHIDINNPRERTLFDLVDSDSCIILKKLVACVVREGQPEHLDVSFQPVGEPPVEVEMSLSMSLRDEESAVVWGVCRDITERKRAQNDLYVMAHHDALTGLPNRLLLEDRLQQAKALANRLQENFALLFLDLDRFKIINDTLGHSVGDELLRLVAGRLKRTLRETDTVARIGGDEFIVLLINVDLHYVGVLAEKILKSLVLPFHLRDHELFITTSLGICMYPRDDQDTEAMMKKADIAMYHAKALGRNNFQFYDSQMDQNASRRFVISNSLRRGLEHNEFRLYYQPKIDVQSGRIVALEALVRWEHPELGLLSPLEFIQLAEENGLIMQLGEWVLREACVQNVKWQAEGLASIRVAVNISGYQLQHKNLLEVVNRILGETGMSPNHLEFEITESVIMQNPDFVVSVLTAITALGIHISVDDFGTGYSSLAHLKRFSVNTLKIDKSFVNDVNLNGTDAAIATAIIAMGNSLNLNVIAEGVETQAQYDFLKDNHCGQVQGYLFSRPLPSGEIVKVLRQNMFDLDDHG
ncbi:MAG: EAL domain-containing protein [Steroidobacteraceae bacterium]|nr:EAL domain-containing protein [Deltaproteobacteria bacterium]